MHLLNRQCQYKAYKDDKSTSFLRGCYLLGLLRPCCLRSRDLPSPLMAIFFIFLSYVSFVNVYQ